MCGGTRKKKSAPAKSAAAPASAGGATPASASPTAAPDKDAGGPANATQRRRQRMGKRGFRVGLNVDVANVGGDGKTGLNIPSSD